MQEDLVVYATKDGLTHEFDALEFLALLSSHIPNIYESILATTDTTHVVLVGREKSDFRKR